MARRRNRGCFALAFGGGLIFASFCPPEVLVVVLAIILVVYGCNC